MASNESSSFQGTYKSLHTPALLIGAASVLVALLISLWLILQHLRSYSNPSVSVACSLDAIRGRASDIMVAFE